MPTPEAVTQLKAAFERVDRYQPVYRFEDTIKDRPVSRECVDRCELLEKHLGPDIPNLRILDIGCSMGYLSLYFAERGAQVVGLDYNQANVDFCTTLANTLDIKSAKFNIGEFGPAFPANLREGQVDVIFLFSVLHHVTAQYGIPAVNMMMQQLIEKTDILFVELARRTENVKFPWKEKLPENELEIFANIPGIVIDNLGEFPALGSTTMRPLYQIRKTAKVFSGIPHKNMKVERSVIRTGQTRDRKYYLTDELFTKCFIVEATNLGTYYRFLSELEVYRRIGGHGCFLPCLGSEVRDSLCTITLPNPSYG